MSKMILSVRSSFRYGLLVTCLVAGLGCSSDTTTTGRGTGGSSSSTSGGAGGSGGTSASGGSSSAGGSLGSGGAGGTSDKGGSTATGGNSATGGSSASVSTSTATGGNSATGGSTAGSGTDVDGGTVTTGGTSNTGGATGLGGAGGSGGSTSKTGGTGAGGTGTGGTGTSGSGGSTSTGGTGAGGTGTGGSGGGTGTGAVGGAKPSEGCGKDPATLKSATVGQASPVNTISGSRQFLVRWPTNYDNSKPYPLHIGLHGHGGDLSENGRDNFGLWSLSMNTVIFVTLAAVSGNWSGAADLTYADAVLKQVESELCIDTSRVMMEGFSQGAAMAWYITGSRPGVYRAVVGHSGGGVSGIPALSPVAYLGSLGTQESGNGQNMQTDQFAKANGCTIENLPTAPQGGHICTPYKGCPAGFPVVWCSYDGGHGFQPTDSGQSKTWMPAEVWSFLSSL